MVLEMTVARAVDGHGKAVRDENEATGGRIWCQLVLLGRRWRRSDHVQTKSRIFCVFLQLVQRQASVSCNVNRE
jgi:hypothetical protein